MNPKNPFRLDFDEREKAFKDGQALQHHVRAVHEGVFSPDCPACQELLRRIEDAEREQTEGDQTKEHEQ